MTTTSKPTPKKRNPESLSVRANLAEDVEPLYARETLRPALSAALTVRKMTSPAPDELTIDALVAELETQAKAVNDGDLKRGEDMLVAQAHALDSIFGLCARRAQVNMGEYPQTVEIYMRLALRAQSQCRATWETLSAMKNPAPVAFVRQANIAAGPQQINNGTAPEASRMRETESTPNRLLEAEHERMDTRAATLAGRGDPQMAAVGGVDGAEVAGR